MWLCGCKCAAQCLVRTTPPRGYLIVLFIGLWPHSFHKIMYVLIQHLSGIRVYFKGGRGGGAFAPTGNLVAAPRKHTTVIIILLLLLKREREM